MDAQTTPWKLRMIILIYRRVHGLAQKRVVQKIPGSGDWEIISINKGARHFVARRFVVLTASYKHQATSVIISPQRPDTINYEKKILVVRLFYTTQ